MGSWKVPYLRWIVGQLIYILTSSDPGNRTVTVLASFSVTGCTNKAFPGEKHKYSYGPQGCIFPEQTLCALGLSISHSHSRSLLGHVICLGSLSTEEKGLCSGADGWLTSAASHTTVQTNHVWVVVVYYCHFWNRSYLLYWTWCFRSKAIMFFQSD